MDRVRKPNISDNILKFGSLIHKVYIVLYTRIQITDMLQSFITRYLRRIINIRWPETISNEDLWRVANQQPIHVQIKKGKLNWTGHTLRKPTRAVEKTALD
jgi:hypothetical protein